MNEYRTGHLDHRGSADEKKSEHGVAENSVGYNLGCPPSQ